MKKLALKLDLDKERHYLEDYLIFREYKKESREKKMKLLKGLGIALVLFYMVIFIGVNFVTVGVDNDNKVETTKETQRYELLDYKAELEDAEILGKFWNDKGYFIVVYNGTTKVPEILDVEFSEWKFMHTGELY